MSSNAAQLHLKSGGLLASFGTALLLSQPVAAQDDQPVTQAQEGAQAEAQAEAQVGSELETTAPRPQPENVRRPRERINLSITVPRNESDQLVEQDCEREADAGRVAGEIVVCRQLGEATDGSFDKDEWERDYARRTQGGSTPDVAGGGIFSGPATFGGMCLIPPCPPEAAIMIDVEALPEAPEGSDADRIARGLPPLGRDPELSPEEIARRRRALGLDAPPLPEE